MSSPEHHPTPVLFCPSRTSKLVASLLRKLASDPESMESAMLQHLRAIEAIESRIGTQDLSPDEVSALIALGHETINEIQTLHLRDEIRHLYVTRVNQHPLSQADD